MEPSPIIVDVQGSVARITLNRPEKRNAFDESLIAAVTDAIHAANTDANVRAIIISGAGPAFCAGGDLAWMHRAAGYSFDDNIADAKVAQEMFAAVYKSPKVTIARAHGAAMGGGAGLVAACDVAVAAADATFAFSEVRLGIIPAVIGPFVVGRIGAAAAKALFVTGERFDAAEALRIGLINRVAEPAALDAAVAEVVKSVLQSSPAAIAAVKDLLARVDGLTPDEAAPLTAEALARIRVSPEGQEGVRAFLEKRKPSFAEKTP